MVNEDGKFTELAGPELENLSVMKEGNEKGTADMRVGYGNLLSVIACGVLISFCTLCVSDLYAEGARGLSERGEVYP